MKPPSPSWSTQEKKQVLAVAVAPLLVVGLVALIASLAIHEDFTLLAIFALPVAYLTLFFSILPALTLLRRWQRESLPIFCAVAYLGTVVPWLVLYAAFTPAELAYPGTGRFASPLIEVAALLSVPGAVAAACAAVVWLLYFPAQNEA